LHRLAQPFDFIRFWGSRPPLRRHPAPTGPRLKRRRKTTGRETPRGPQGPRNERLL